MFLYPHTSPHIHPAIFLVLVFAIAILSSARTFAGAADSPNSSYAGKTIKIFVGFRPGAAYDLYARLTARHLVRHIPGSPAIIIENSPESAAKTAETIYHAASDGETLAALIPALYLQQLTGKGQGRFDLTKFTWIGSPTKSHYLLYMGGDAPYKSMRDVIQSSSPPVCGLRESQVCLLIFL